MTEIVRELLERNACHADQFENERFSAVQDGQTPDAVTVCCSDSRVLQDAMFQNRTPGAIFTVGVIGNRVYQETDEGMAVSGDVLYPVEHTGTKTVVVVGHTGCGAVTATYWEITEGIDEPAGISHSIDLLKPRLAPGVEALPEGLDEEQAINHLVEYNVDQQVEFLLASDDVPEDVDVVGMVYDFQDVYSEKRGLAHVINVNGARAPDKVRDPELAARMQRLWKT